MVRTEGDSVPDRPEEVLLAVLDEDCSAEIAGALQSYGYRTVRVREAGRILERLGQAPPALVVIAEGAEAPARGEPFPGLRSAARARKIPLLDVLEPGGDPARIADRHCDADDWILRPALAAELPLRVGCLLARRRQDGPAAGPAFDGLPFLKKLLSLIVHDLRTPLNVIGLTLRIIEETAAPATDLIQEDLDILQENVDQIEGMLSLLSDYHRLLEGGLDPAPLPFDPRQLVRDLLEQLAERDSGFGRVRVEVDEDCPPEVELDANRARQALKHLLVNTAAAAGDGSIQLRIGGRGDRLRIECTSGTPPPIPVTSGRLRSEQFNRLIGTNADRLGLELAVTTRVTELFGGTAMLEAAPGPGTTVILEWPVRATAAVGSP